MYSEAKVGSNLWATSLATRNGWISRAKATKRGMELKHLSLFLFCFSIRTPVCSYHYARRQYNLVDDDLLRYKFLNRFDAAMNALESQYHWLKSPQAYVSRKHEDDKLVAFERANLLFIFNLHPNKSFTDYPIGTNIPGKYTIVLNTDSKVFGGDEHVLASSEYITSDAGFDGRRYSIQVYIPSRSALVLKPSSI